MRIELYSHLYDLPAQAHDDLSLSWVALHESLVVATLLSLLAIIGLGVLINRRLIRRLRNLAATARAVAAGDLERRSQVCGSDEAGRLADSFNAMTAQLVEHYQALRSESRERAAIIESISDGVIVCAEDGTVQMVNRAMRSLLKLEEGAALPRRLASLPLEKLEEPEKLFGDWANYELFRLHERIVRVIASPMAYEDGTSHGMVVVAQDVTDLIAADRARSTFITIISHELRTPLTVLAGNMDMLGRELLGPLNETQRTVVEMTRRRVESMTALMQNTILLATLDAGKLELNIHPFNLVTLVRDRVRLYRERFGEKALALVVDLPDEPVLVLGDETHVMKVLDHLLDNALRYTTQGMVSIRIQELRERVHVEVADTGQGISAELREQLFTRFARGTGQGEGINSAVPGLGLGLAIARQLIERTGGEIWLEQSSEHGSTFCFALPMIDYSTSSLERVLERTV